MQIHAFDRSTIHDLKLDDGLAFVVLIWHGACRLAPDDGKFHMLDFDAYEKEKNASDDHIFEVIPG